MQRILEYEYTLHFRVLNNIVIFKRAMVKKRYEKDNLLI